MATVHKFDIAGRRISTDDTVAVTPDALFSDLSTDTLYVSSGTSVSPMHAGAVAPATWRSKTIKAPSGVPTGFAWIRLNGELSAGAVVKLFADGVLIYTTPSITTGEPVRTPSRMARAWEVELSGTSRVTSVVLSDQTEGLL